MLLNCKRHIDRRGAEVNMIKFFFFFFFSVSPSLFYIFQIQNILLQIYNFTK